MLYKRSSELFVEANKVIPGGVNSPVRAFKGVGGTPIFAKEAKGAYLYDEDGNRLIDYINSWGPMILGHAYEPVVNAVIEKAKKGTSFGMPTELETQIAQLAVSMVPNIDISEFITNTELRIVHSKMMSFIYNGISIFILMQIVVLAYFIITHITKPVNCFLQILSDVIRDDTPHIAHHIFRFLL